MAKTIVHDIHIQKRAEELLIIINIFKETI